MFRSLSNGVRVLPALATIVTAAAAREAVAVEVPSPPSVELHMPLKKIGVSTELFRGRCRTPDVEARDGGGVRGAVRGRANTRSVTERWVTDE